MKTTATNDELLADVQRAIDVLKADSFHGPYAISFDMETFYYVDDPATELPKEVIELLDDLPTKDYAT